MSLTALIEEAGVDPNAVEVPPVVEVADTVVSPTNDPSSTIPIPAEVPMVPVSELEDAVATAVVEANVETLEAEHCALQEKADELLDIQHSMEALEQIVRKSGFKGITNQTAEVIQLQLRSAQRKLGITGKMASIESFNAKDLREQHDQATVSIEDIRETAKKAVAKFIEMIKRLFGMMKKQADNYLDGISQLKGDIGKLDDRLGALKKPGGEGTISLKNTSLLHIGDKIERGVPSDLTELARTLDSKYASAVALLFGELGKLVKDYTGEDADVDELKQKIAIHVKMVDDFASRVESADGYPGGYNIVRGENGRPLTFKVIDDVSNEPLDLPVATTRELRTVVRVLDKLTDYVLAMRKSIDNLDKTGHKLIDVVNNGEYSDAVISTLGGLVKQNTPDFSEFLKYFGRYCKFQIAFVNAQADIIEGKTSKEE